MVTSEAIVDGVRYQSGDYVINEITDSGISFLRLTNIYLYNGTVIGEGTQCVVRCFHAHYNAYSVKNTDLLGIFLPQTAVIPWPLIAFAITDGYLLFPMCLPDVEVII